MAENRKLSDEKLEELLRIIKEGEPIVVKDQEHTSDTHEEVNIEELLEILKRFEPKEPDKAEVKPKEADVKDVKRKVNSMVNDAFKAAKRIKKEEQAEKKQDEKRIEKEEQEKKKQYKERIEELKKMARETKDSEFENFSDLDEPIEFNSIQDAKEQEERIEELKKMARETKDSEFENFSDLEEHVEPNKAHKQEKVFKRESQVKMDRVEKSDLKANELINKLNELYEKALNKKSFFKRMIIKARVIYLEDAIKERKESVDRMTDMRKKAESEFVEKYGSIEQKLFEKNKELEINRRVLNELNAENERREEAYRERKIRDKRINKIQYWKFKQYKI